MSFLVSFVAELRSKLLHFAGRSGFDSSLQEEMQSHKAMRVDELVANGMCEREAFLTAEREFGSTARIAEESREAWRWSWMEDLGRDLRYASRALMRDRRFALSAVVSLALGIGVNTMMFSLAASFLLSEPSVHDPKSIVSVSVGGRGQVQMQEFRYLRQAGVFSELIGFDENGEFNWRSGNSNARLFGVRVTENFFEVTRVPLAAGRATFRNEPNVVVVSHRFWKTSLHGDNSDLGRALILDGEPYTIVGVLAPNHRTLIGLGFAPEIYLPVRSEAARFSLYGRMPEGAQVSDLIPRLREACTEMDRIYPDPNAKWATFIEINPVTGIARFVAKRKMLLFVQFFAMLMIVVGLVLTIACTNVASLLLARSATRMREFALRLSLGATRGRLIRQLLAESLLLSLAGAAVGLWMSWLLTQSLNGLLLPLPVPIRLAVEPEWTLLLYAAAVAVASAVMAGLLPAISSTRSMSSGLKQEERQVGASAKLRKTVVAVQVGVSVVVLVTAALFVRNLMLAAMTDPGFDLKQTIWAQMRLIPEKYSKPGETYAFSGKVLEQLRATPGVEAATYTNVVPLNDQSNNTGRVTVGASEASLVLRYQTFVVADDYFKTMSIPLLAGREFQAADLRGGPRLVILNEAMARVLFGSEREPAASLKAVGQTVQFGQAVSIVIGVCANGKYGTLGEEERFAIYEPYVEGTDSRANLAFLIRSALPPSALTRTINLQLLAMDSDAAVEVKPMREAMGFALLPSRAGASLLGVTGALGLVLAAIGLFGVLSYSVSRRIREIGLRMALGAKPGDIVKLILGEGAWIVMTGLAGGLFVAAFITKPLSLFLVAGLNSWDPVTYAAVASLLVLVGCLACLKPAIHALRSDPAVALRLE